MREERLEVSVTFDERGYIGSAPELRSSVMALSLGGLRRKIEIAMLPDDVRVVLHLDGLAERPGADFIPMKSARWRNVYNPSVTSAQRSTVLPFRKSITPGSIIADRSCGSTAVATTMSQRSLKTTDSAVLPGGLRAVSV